jgi:hypothetical protein
VLAQALGEPAALADGDEPGAGGLALAPGLTPRSVFEKFAAVQMIDVSIPTTDVSTLTLTRYTEPEPEPRL